MLSDLTLRELERAPERVRTVLEQVPQEHKETVSDSGESAELAQAYIEAGAVGVSSRADAAHVALATLSGADVLASWNFQAYGKLAANPVLQRGEYREGA